MEEQEDLVTSIASMYYLSTIIGLSPYVLTGHYGNRRFIKGRFHILYQICYLILHALIIAAAFYFKVENKAKSQFDQKLVLFEICTGLFITAVVIFCHNLFKFGILRIVKEIYELDNRFSAFGIQIEHNTVNKRCLSIVAYLLLTALWYANVTTMSCQINDIYYWALFFIQYLLTMTMKSHFCVLNLMIKYRFKALDAKLKEVIDSTKKENIKENKIILVGTKNASNSQMSPTAAKVITLSEFHSKLYNISLRLNYFYSVQILLITGKYFVEITGTLYFNLQMFYKKDSLKTYDLYAFNYLVWAFLNAIDLLMLVYICDSMCTTANNSKLTLHKINLNSKDIELKKEVTAFSLQLLHNDLVLTAAGFFNIDFTLVFNIIGGVTTYLVIFIQFDMTDTKRPGNSTSLITSTTENLLYTYLYPNETLFP